MKEAATEDKSFGSFINISGILNTCRQWARFISVSLFIWSFTPSAHWYDCVGNALLLSRNIWIILLLRVLIRALLGRRGFAIRIKFEALARQRNFFQHFALLFNSNFSFIKFSNCELFPCIKKEVQSAKIKIFGALALRA